MNAIKSIFIVCVSLFLCYTVSAQEKKEMEYGQYNLTEVQKEVQMLRKQYSSQKNDLEKRYKDMRREINKLQMENRYLKSRLDSLNAAIIEVGDTLGIKLRNTNNIVTVNKASVDEDLHELLLYGGCGLTLPLLIALGVYFILHKRIGKGTLDIAAIKETNKKLTEQSVALDNKITEVLEKQLKADKRVPGSSDNKTNKEVDHSLVLSIANEIMRIEQNLAFMDLKTKGVSQLRNRVAAISALLTSKGYEVPNLIGTEFKDGMNYEAVMEEDENMESGIMKIKRVTRPCVMYQGKMIQSAKVVVAYNPETTE